MLNLLAYLLRKDINWQKAGKLFKKQQLLFSIKLFITLSITTWGMAAFCSEIVAFRQRQSQEMNASKRIGLIQQKVTCGEPIY
ncbi:MAG: hypothetical protein IPH82_14755 [Chloroflexi bacterium]|nr:hypothetical protein [Chloroflexota bacterium]